MGDNNFFEKIKSMSRRSKYIILIIFAFILYGNTLFHEYALDDTMVITENEYTLSGVQGIDDLFSEEFFSGFFDQKNKKLVAGGRYRPLSIVTFAIEWQLIMGTPFDGVSMSRIEHKMNQSAKSNFIHPSQKLLKKLSRTIHINNRSERIQSQEQILNQAQVFNKQQKHKILSNLERMNSRRDVLLFVSHLINVLLYSISVLVLFIVLEKLLVNYKKDTLFRSIPFLASLLFLAHPIHTEVVANIKGRDEILSLLGALLTLLISLKYFEKRKVGYLLLSFFAFLIGIFSKELAVTFLAIIPLSIYFFTQPKRLFGDILIILIPLIVATGIYFYVRSKVVGGFSFESGQELMNNSFLGMSMREKFATIFYTLLLYIKLLIFPHPLTYDYYPYHIPVMNWSNLWPVVGLIVYIGLGIYALIRIKQKSLVSYGILFYLIALSPMSNVLFPIGVFMNERFIYAASIGFVIILAYLIAEKLPGQIKNQNVVVAIAMGILLLYSVKTISRNTAWKNDFTLFTHDVKISENSAKSNTTAGGKLIEEAIKTNDQELKTEYLDQAILYLKRAVDIYPRYNDALLLLGNAQWERYGSLDSTFKYYERILIHNPGYDKVYTNIFRTNVKQVFDNPEKVDNNIKILHKLEKYNSTSFYVNYYLGKIYGRYKNNLEASIDYLERAALINPDNVMVFKDLGVAYGLANRFESSANALSAAVKLDPDDPVLRMNLAMTYLNLRQVQKGKEIMDEMFKMEFDQSNAHALVKLGYLYRNIGNLQRAQQCFDKAKEVNPQLFNVK